MTTHVLETPVGIGERYAGFGATAGVGVLFVGVLLGTSSGFVAVPQPPHVESSSWFAASSAAVKGDPPRTQKERAVPVLTNRDLLEHLRESAGLTWDQTARLFNVSRRSIHLWLAGGRMSAGNEERLLEIVKVVDALPAQTPEQKRHFLLQPAGGGRSAFDSFRASSASADGDINRNIEPLASADSGASA